MIRRITKRSAPPPQQAPKVREQGSLMRRIAKRATPPPQAPGVLEQASLLLKVELLPLWLFWVNLRALLPWWPVLLPALAWYARRVYRAERAARRAAAAPGAKQG